MVCVHDRVRGCAVEDRCRVRSELEATPALAGAMSGDDAINERVTSFSGVVREGETKDPALLRRLPRVGRQGSTKRPTLRQTFAVVEAEGGRFGSTTVMGDGRERSAAPARTSPHGHERQRAWWAPLRLRG